MKIISRAEWGARSPSGGRNSINARPLGTAVHWNGPGCAASIRTHDKCAGFVRGIQNFHMDVRGWSDIAYTDFACPHGYLFEGRGKGVGTAANGTTYGNLNYYAVYVMWGKGDGPVPEVMLDTVAGAVALHRTWGAGDEVTKHRSLFGTECPGDELSALVDSGRFDKVTAPKPGGAQSMPRPQRPTPTPKPKPAASKAPKFPLPRGHWYGVESSDRRNHSGYYAKDRAGVRAIQTRLRSRGWVGLTETNGRYGANTKKIVTQFQREKGLRVDGAVGAQTWAALWSEPVT